MTLDLDSLVASLPAKKEQKRVQEMEQRRSQILNRFPDDATLNNTRDPRSLNSVGQCMYIIKCIEHGLTKAQIVDLFSGDEFVVDTIIGVIGVNNLVK